MFLNRYEYFFLEKLMATLPIAPTTFETAPDQKLAVVDVYEQSGKTPDIINNEPNKKELGLAQGVDGILPKLPTPPWKSLVDDNLKRWTDPVKGIENIMNDIGSIVENPKDLVRGFTAGYTQEFFKTLGYDVPIDGIMKAMDDPKSLVKFNSKDFSNIANAINPEWGALIEGTSKVIKDVGEVNDLKSAAKLIAGLTGDSNLLQIMNLTAYDAMIKSVFNFAFAYNIPDLIDQIIEKTVNDRRNIRDRRRLELMACLPAAQNTNLDYIKKVGEDSKIGYGAISSSFPDLGKVIVNHYNRKNLQGNPTSDEAKKLVDLLFILNPNWMYYLRDGVKFDNAEYLVDASSDGLEILKLDDRTIYIACSAQAYKAKDHASGTLELRVYTPPETLSQFDNTSFQDYLKAQEKLKEMQIKVRKEMIKAKKEQEDTEKYLRVLEDRKQNGKDLVDKHPRVHGGKVERLDYTYITPGA